MKRNTLSKLFAATTIATALAAGPSAQAVPVTGFYLEDPRCDTLPNQTLTHELGNITYFPINEAIQASATPTTKYICVLDDLVVNDWEIRMINNSPIAWKNLFFVANIGMTVGNADGNMIDVINAPGVITDAFRIDGTVTPGINSNLLAESGIVDEIFSPGEQWTFYVTNFMNSTGTTPPPLFNTPGLFAGSAPVLATFPDTASILAQPVPEPDKFTVLALAVGALFMRRPRFKRS